MKKIVYTLIIILFTATAALSQSRDIKRADKYFKKMAYVKAAELYEAIAEETPDSYVTLRLAESYYLNHQMEKAVQWYSRLYSNYNYDDVKPENMFRYAQALRAIGNYEDSNFWIKQFNQANKEDSRGEEYVAKEMLLKKIASPEKPNYKVKLLHGVNTEFSDFGVTRIGDTILFSSSRKKKKGKWVKRKFMRNEQNFLDLYQARVNDSLGAFRIQDFELNLSSGHHESNIAFSPDKKTMYVTRNSYSNGKYKKSKAGINEFKIYEAKWIDNKWQKFKALPFCSNEYSVGHPTVSKDGKRLYFSSNMPGTIGETDIFYVTINEDGTYGPVQNLGIEVNTEGREVFPYITEDNTLYFSSDGHFGLGGLDVFKTKVNGDAFSEPENLMAPLNSKADDFSFSVNSNGNGFVSSNREGGVGDDDIYSFSTKEYAPEIPKVVAPCIQTVTGFIKDSKFKVPLNEARILIKNNIGETIKDTIVGADGKFVFALPCNQKFTALASKEYYKPDQDTFSTTNAAEVDLDLTFEMEIVDEFTYNERNELIIKIKPIFFDYNKSDIRVDAALELESVIAAMKKYPKIEIRSSSHTDARGRASYNMALSDRRAKSTVKYILNRGISSSRITGKGFGETQLTNKCVDNDKHTNRVNCSKEEHQANRRTEFVITKM